MNFASLNASDPDADLIEVVVGETAAAGLAGEVLAELHRYG